MLVCLTVFFSFLLGYSISLNKYYIQSAVNGYLIVPNLDLLQITLLLYSYKYLLLHICTHFYLVYSQECIVGS